MKEIIKHGKTEKYIHTCSSCGCVFTYGHRDLIGLSSAGNGIVQCPCCKNKQSTQTILQTATENASVSLIAKMQRQIDTFKAALLHASERILHGNKCDMVVIDPLDDCDKHHLKTIFKFIDEHTTTA